MEVETSPFYFTIIHRIPKSFNTKTPAPISIKIPYMINIYQPPCQEASHTRHNGLCYQKGCNARNDRYTKMVDGFHNLPREKL